MTLVVDASAICAIAFGEADGPTIAAHIEGESLIAPAVFDYEVASTAIKKIRRHPEMREQILDGIEIARSIRITKVDVSPFDAVPLALEARLSGYDATYLWLAHSRDLELVTLDQRLARADQARRG